MEMFYTMFTLYLIAFRADTKSMRSKVLKAATHMRTGTSGSHASEHRSVAVGRECIVLRIPILIPEYLLQVEKCPIFHFFFLIRNHSFDPILFFSTNLENVLRSSFMSNFEYNISKTFNSLSRVFAHMASSCDKFATKWSVYNKRKEYNSHRTGLGHKMARAFVLVLGHQHGNREVMWKGLFIEWKW